MKKKFYNVFIGAASFSKKNQFFVKYIKTFVNFLNFSGKWRQQQFPLITLKFQQIWESNPRNQRKIFKQAENVIILMWFLTLFFIS